MKAAFGLLLAVAGALISSASRSAHPHIWIQQVVRVVAKDGKYTHVEIEWRFDPFSSEIEIPADRREPGRQVLGQAKPRRWPTR